MKNVIKLQRFHKKKYKAITEIVPTNMRVHNYMNTRECGHNFKRRCMQETNTYARKHMCTISKVKEYGKANTCLYQHMGTILKVECEVPRKGTCVYEHIGTTLEIISCIQIRI